MPVKESNLMRVNAIDPNDLVRIVQQDSSRNIPYSNFVTDVEQSVLNMPEAVYFTTHANTDLNINVPDGTPTGGNIILLDMSVSPFTAMLPLASEMIASSGRSYVLLLKKIDASATDAIIKTQTGQKIDGHDEIKLTGPRYPFVKIFSDGANYWTIS